MTTTVPLGDSPAPTSNDLKRKRSSEEERSEVSHAIPKTQRTANSHLAINYLARQFDQDLPLLSTDDALPAILHLLNEYQGVLERHESMACNMGARPLGPILIKRFERLFDGPPKILKNHGKEGNVVTWLDVVEFARSKPEQFLLGQMSEGLRVCQIYIKGCRVQISEEDYMLINSGIPQKMIPPQPIVEDEEKELGTLEILDKSCSSISHLADQVAARTRQLKHRINGRRQAILERRANEPGPVIRGTSPSVLNGSGMTSSHLPYGDANGRPVEYSKTGASAATRAELMSKFATIAEKDRRESGKQPPLNGDSRIFSTPDAMHNGRSSAAASLVPQQEASATNGHDYNSHDPTSRNSTSHQNRFTQSPSTNAYGDSFSVHSFTIPPPAAAAGVIKEVKSENDGPFRAEMVMRMEILRKGDRVLPPCDRCRRLHMDCMKNLTACVGCTKKHAKCSWRDVSESELWGPEKGKVPIPPHPSGDGEGQDHEREASVGLRPDQTSAQLLQALNEHNHGQSAGPPEDYSIERALALEGLAAASNSGNGDFGSHHPAQSSGFNSPMTPHVVHSAGPMAHSAPSAHTSGGPYDSLRFEPAPVASMRPESPDE